MRALRKIQQLNKKLVALILVLFFFFPKIIEINVKAYSPFIDQYNGKTMAVIGDSISSYDPAVYGNSVYDKYCYSTRAGAANPEGSTTEMVNVAPESMWWGIVETGAKMNISSIASVWGSTVVNGGGSNGPSGNTDERVAAVTGADVIFIMLGTNDAAYNVDANSVKAEYSSMLQKLKAANPDSKIIALTVIEYSGATRIGDINSAIKAAAQENGIDYIDVHSCGITQSSIAGEHNGDGAIHPNAIGQGLMGQYILNNLPALEDPPPIDTSVTSNPSNPTNPTGNNPTPVSGPMTTEVIDLDDLGRFKMPGNPDSITYNGKTNPITRLFDGLKNILDYIMGILFGAIKAVFVGWAEILETIFDGILHSVEEA